MFTTRPQKENRFILFVKFFVLPAFSILAIVFIIQQFKEYAEIDDLIEKTAVQSKKNIQKEITTPKISSLSKGIDKK